MTNDRYQRVLKHILHCDKIGMWLTLEPELYLTDAECVLMASKCRHTYGWIRRTVRRAATGGKLTKKGFKL